MRAFHFLLGAVFLFVLDASGIEDFLGKKHEKPQSANRLTVTCYGGAVQELLIFSTAEKIVAHPGAQRFAFFEKISPLLAKRESVGTFSEVNLETLYRVNPDVVFAGVSSLAMNERIEKSGIEVFTLGIGRHTLKTLLKEFEALGDFLDNREKSERLIAFWRERLELIGSQLPPVDKRVKVLYANGSNSLTSEGKGWWGDEFIRHSGGINIAESLQVKGPLSLERVLEFDPDVIILSNNKNFQTSKESITQNPHYKNLNAVKNAELYVAPVGGFWWDRPSPEAILGILWLAKVLYPQEMHRVDLYKQTRLFYKEFYGYELKREEYRSFFASDKETL